MLHKDLYELTLVKRVKVSRNNLGQPVGSKARLLARYLGIIARNANMLPINYESWHQMPDSNKNQALDNIKERFALEVSDTYIKRALGKKWRDHKKRYKPQREIVKCPAGDAKDRKQVGTSSRQKQKFTHTTGSKSFAYVTEAEELSPGQKVGRLELFDITNRKKDGSPMTSEAGEIKLEDKKAEYETIASSDSSVNLEDINNRIITEVLGPKMYGRVQIQGSGVNPIQYFGSSSQQYMPSGSQAQAEV
ncbi:Magnesium-protoporphyrin IX monomethyl ester [oxidative] cyclase 2 [Gossypium arboreum]|uniref:Magnesium-protoporphyrin IX monomethyl ester [oxidative] cyclase 2 n=1 Tax=Gossypium arboreum TaxID=29729 RepID=A0A0B0NXS9_GOSAR|nr:Magnesium-protoporphyrin IX monomethyl ester [oxidative] cyclase 2 [Gossypium arboreum]